MVNGAAVGVCMQVTIGGTACGHRMCERDAFTQKFHRGKKQSHFWPGRQPKLGQQKQPLWTKKEQFLKYLSKCTLQLWKLTVILGPHMQPHFIRGANTNNKRWMFERKSHFWCGCSYTIFQCWLLLNSPMQGGKLPFCPKVALKCLKLG